MVRDSGASVFLLLALGSLCCAGADESSSHPQTVVHDLVERCKASKAYLFETDMQLEAGHGNNPGRLLSKARVKIAMAPEGKSFLQIEPIDKNAYILVSNGQKTWAYLPALKQYTEQEAAPVEDSDENDPGDAGDERDLSERFVRLIFSKLSTLDDNVAQIVAAGETEVKYAGRKQTWPVIKVLSKPDEKGGQVSSSWSWTRRRSMWAGWCGPR